MSCISYEDLFNSYVSFDKVEHKYQVYFQNMVDLCHPYEFGCYDIKKYNYDELTPEQLKYNSIGLFPLYVHLYFTSNGQVEILCKEHSKLPLVLKTPDLIVSDSPSEIVDYNISNKYRLIKNIDDLLSTMDLDGYSNSTFENFLISYSKSGFITEYDVKLTLDIVENSMYGYFDIMKYYFANVTKKKESHERVFEYIIEYKKVKIYRELFKLLPPIGFDISNN